MTDTEFLDADTESTNEDQMRTHTSASLSRRGALAALTGLGVLGLGSAPASADSGHDHLGQTWSGSVSPGLEIQIDSGDALVARTTSTDNNFDFGIVGRTNAQSGRGVAGFADNDSGNSIALLGRNQSSNGVGIRALCDAETGSTNGIFGQVRSPNGRGIYATNTSDSGGPAYGCVAQSNSSAGTGLLGTAIADSGETYGVRGEVDSPDGYGLYTPDDAKLDGEVDTQDAWQVNVDGDRTLDLGSSEEIEFNDNDFTSSGNVTAGQLTEVEDGAQGATIGGGGSHDDEGDESFANVVTDHWSTIGGGHGNQAGDGDGDPESAANATVSGGAYNTASGSLTTISGGASNEASALLATVSGGFANTASGARGTIGGGWGNVTSDTLATVGGGFMNSAEGMFTTIAGGGPTDTNFSNDTKNVVYDDYGTIGGGGNNRAGDEDEGVDAEYTTISGGESNEASGQHGTVGGGVNNVASGGVSTVAGGSGNQAIHQRTTVSGGRDNVADNYNATVGGGLGNNDPGDSEFQAGDASTIGGGYWNVAGGSDGGGFNRNQTVGGGRENEATAQEATVGGGRDNAASGRRATVPGGFENVADGNYSFAAGRNATANHDGSIVFGDSTTSEVTSQSTNEARFQMDTRVEGDLTVNDGGDLTFSYLRFGADDGSSPRLFYSNSSRAFSLTDGDELRLFMDVRSTGDVKPYNDNGSSLGTSDDRWSEVWATNGTIQTSDARLKTNVSDLDDGLARVQALRPVSFEWTDKEDDHDSEDHLGLIAQEVEEVVPEAVTRPDDDGYLGVNYQALVPVLVDAIQRQQEQLDEKDAKLAEKDEQLDDLNTRVDALSDRVMSIEATDPAGVAPADD